MALDIDPGNGMDWPLSYTRTNPDGTKVPGTIDLTNSQTEIIMVPPDGAEFRVGAFDPVTGVQANSVEHNANIGEVSITINNDGDMGSGAPVQLTITRVFMMKSLGGSDGVSGEPGPQRPTPPMTARRRP